MLLLLLLTGIPGAFIIYFSVRSYYLRTEGIVTKAVIIDDKNYFGNGTVSHDFSYSYRFTVNGEEYTGDSRSRKYSVGQTVEIKYAANHPCFNEVCEPK